MFGFLKKKESTLITAEEVRGVLVGVKERWDYFKRTIHLKDGASLVVELELFVPPVVQFIRTEYPRIFEKGPDQVEHIITSGIALSQSHSKEEISAALNKLNHR